MGITSPTARVQTNAGRSTYIHTIHYVWDGNFGKPLTTHFQSRHFRRVVWSQGLSPQERKPRHHKLFVVCASSPLIFYLFLFSLGLDKLDSESPFSIPGIYVPYIYRRENKKQKKCTRGYAVSKHRVGLQICTCGTFMYQVRSINQWAVVPLLSTGSRLHTIKSEASILAVLDYPRFSLYTWYACTRYIYTRARR